MKDYTQKTVYIGIDVHKKTYALTAICDNIVVKKDTIAAYPEQLVKYIKKYFKGATIKTVYEAGFSGFDLHRQLIAHKIDNIVVHPGAIKTAANDRVKTDKRDSLKMAKQLANGELKGIHVPSKKREGFRMLTRLRDQILENRKRTGNQLKSLLFTQGLIDPSDDTKISKGWLNKVQELPLSADLKYSVDLFINIWLDLDNKLKDLLLKIQEQAQSDKIDMIYRSAPGIGALSARILANELEDMKHFSNVKGLYSYTGLTPSEYSSGEHKWLGISVAKEGLFYERSWFRQPGEVSSWIHTYWRYLKG